mmetsp:Transcript_20775/g.44964  ORF Transcript_20775/g.44964 Transcript_20775/m.44964 type:complete len:139 (+) Transcript_20775:93-509(+)
MQASLALIVVLLAYGDAFRSTSQRAFQRHTLHMAMDNFIRDKLESVKNTFDALTERLSDPDMANDRSAMLTVSRERKAMEGTVVAYNEWTELEWELGSLTELEQDGDTEMELKVGTAYSLLLSIIYYPCTIYYVSRLV